jgi:hypothetical protein
MQGLTNGPAATSWGNEHHRSGFSLIFLTIGLVRITSRYLLMAFAVIIHMGVLNFLMVAGVVFIMVVGEGGWRPTSVDASHMGPH